MNINKKSNYFKKSVGALASLILLMSAGAYTAYIYKVGPFTSLRQEASNHSDATNPRQKENLPSVEEAAKTGANQTTDQIPAAHTGTLTITTLAQRDDSIIYSASLENIDTTGTCSALFEHADGAARPVTHTTFSTDFGCSEATVSRAEFTARGTWNLTLRYYINNTQLVSTKSIEVR